MGGFKYIIPLAIAVGITIYYVKLSVPAVPEVKDSWWGIGPEQPEDTEIHPFTINVSYELIEYLNHRLQASLENLTPPLEYSSFEYGFNSDTLHKIIRFWKDDYVWKTREKYLNTLPQYKTYISGLAIHFIHISHQSKIQNKTVKLLPILLLHGWPGSFREMCELVTFLRTPRPFGSTYYAFEIVIPSLPGFGFSEGAHRPGLTTANIGLIMKKLMERIGLPQFYIHGGNLGSIIAIEMAILYPKSVAGIHSNLCLACSPLNVLKIVIGAFTSPTLFGDVYSTPKIYPLSRLMSFLIHESGFLHLQATKPDTIGIALRDSPVGLAAYILEKFSTWTRPSWISAPDGGLNLGDEPIHLVDGGNLIPLSILLDNVMIYFVTGSITTSMRIFLENFSPQYISMNFGSIPVEGVPVSCVRFRNELFHTPEFALQSKFPRLVRLHSYEHGGHFAALEEPEILAEDIWAGVMLMTHEQESIEL